MTEAGIKYNNYENEEVEETEVGGNSHESEMSALDELLSLGTDTEIIAEVDMKPRFQKPWTVRALDNTTNERLVNRASSAHKSRGGAIIREMNGPKYARLVVAECVKDPNLREPKLYEKYGLRKGEQDDVLIARILLPGEIDKLSSKILDISGFNDDLVEVGKG